VLHFFSWDAYSVCSRVDDMHQLLAVAIPLFPAAQGTRKEF
jgi:hypothetical protein